MNQLVKINIIFFILLNLQVGFSQQKEYKLVILDTSLSQIKKASFSDSLTLISFLEKHKNKSVAKAYIEAGYYKIEWADTVTAFFNKGEKYTWGKVEINNNRDIIPRSSFKNLQNNKKVSINDFEKELEQTIIFLENNGYPFSSIKLDSVTINNNSVDAKIKIEKNKYISIDSINIKGNTNTSIKYLQLYLDLKEEQAYNEAKIISIDEKLSNLSFINVKQPTEILFYKDKVTINLYADKKQVNKFDGILGVVPNDKTTGKLAVTGELKMLLKNSFGRGESIIAEWQKTDSESQKLNIGLDFPYIFNSIIGVNGLFDLLKQDTSFVNIRSRGGLSFLMPNNKRINVFVENKTSNLLSVSQYANATVLPDFADTKIILYGLGVMAKKTNRAFSPTKGYMVYVEAAYGNKTIKKNSKLPEELYSDINLSSAQIESRLNTLLYTRFTKHINLKLRGDVVYINNEKLFQNELYRFGGLKTLRGFNEDELYADFITSGTVQLNYFYEEYSSFYIFTDMAYYENHVNGFIHDTPIGVGVGTNFSTNAGIFTVSYALGKQFNNSFQFNSARIHIGYISVF